MRRKEAELSKLRKGSNSYKVAVGKMRAECGRMAAEERKRRLGGEGGGDMRPALEEKKMKKRLEIEMDKKKEDEKIACERKKEEDARNERMRTNLGKALKVIGEENKEVEEKREKKIFEGRRWRDERQARMEERRAKEDRERQEKYEREIEDLPPLEPLEEMVEDEQRPSTSRNIGTTNFTRTITRSPSWGREESDEWDEDKWEKTVESIGSRPEFGENRGDKGKGKKGSMGKKKVEAKSFGDVMDEKEHELLDSRCSILYEISQGVESAKQGNVSVEDKVFFEKLERGYRQLEEERAKKNIPKVWERAGLKGAEEEEEEREEKESRGRKKDRKRDSKEGRNRERRESRDEGERKYRERKGSKEGSRRKESRRSSSRSDA